MTGKIFGKLGNESLWEIKFDVLKSSNNFQKYHLINFSSTPYIINMVREYSNAALFMAQVTYTKSIMLNGIQAIPIIPKIMKSPAHKNVTSVITYLLYNYI